ncbi:hypothetical protein [Streptomyces aurantiacus]|uniref:hypothetical protein n=1 Tax=Streptomyces aurantiacus TaxID=47760 RepID=UPI003F4D676F
MVDDPKTGPVELRYLSARLSESLRDVLRVAESRGARLPAPDADADADADDEDEDGDGDDAPGGAIDLPPAR